MFRYTIYGLCFQSDFTLTGLPEGKGEPDVVVRRDILDDDAIMSEPNRGGRIFGYILKDLAFLVRDGNSITIDVRSGITDEEVRWYILGVLMAMVLRQRGLLPLHACCVARDGQAFGFVGESGWGKSTLAAMFCEQGYVLLNDDVLAIQVQPDGSAFAVPGYPFIKLWPDSGTHLREDYGLMPVILPGVAKRVHQVETFPKEPVPLAGLFLLNPTYGSATAIEPVPPGEALIRLVAHTHTNHLFHHADSMSKHMQLTSRLIRHVPIMNLHRVRSLDRLPEIVSLVEQEIEKPLRAA